VLLVLRFFSNVRQVLVETFAATEVRHSLTLENIARFPVHRRWQFNVVASIFVQFLQKIGNCKGFRRMPVFDFNLPYKCQQPCYSGPFLFDIIVIGFGIMHSLSTYC